jgi:hypothetical protein
MLAASVTLVDRHWSWPKRRIGRILLSLLPYTRAAGYWLLKATRGGTGAAKQLETWNAVIEQKHNWINGFSPADTANDNSRGKPAQQSTAGQCLPAG